MAVTGDWQVSYRGLDLGVGSPYTLVQAIEGLMDYPGVVTEDQPRLRQHGLTPGADFLSGRSTVWQVQVSIRDLVGFAAAWSALRRALSPGMETEAPLIFRIPGVADGGVRRIVGRPRRLSMPIGPDHVFGVGTVTIQFDASDPRIYDDVESTVSTDLAAAVTGHAWPQTWPMDWGGASTSGIVTATNEGTYAAPWTATITGPVVNPSIENVDTGQALNFSANGGLALAVGETLVIDSATRTALLGGTASRYDRLASPVSWWDLDPGDTRLRFGGSTTGTPTMAVTWRSAWI